MENPNESSSEPPCDRRERRHRRVQGLPVFPEHGRAHGLARKGGEDGERSRLPAQRSVLRCGGRRRAPRARRLVLRGAAPRDEAGRRALRLLGGRPGGLSSKNGTSRGVYAAETSFPHIQVPAPCPFAHCPLVTPHGPCS